MINKETGKIFLFGAGANSKPEFFEDLISQKMVHDNKLVFKFKNFEVTIYRFPSKGFYKFIVREFTSKNKAEKKLKYNHEVVSFFSGFLERAYEEQKSFKEENSDNEPENIFEWLEFQKRKYGFFSFEVSAEEFFKIIKIKKILVIGEDAELVTKYAHKNISDKDLEKFKFVLDREESEQNLKECSETIEFEKIILVTSFKSSSRLIDTKVFKTAYKNFTGNQNNIVTEFM